MKKTYKIIGGAIISLSLCWFVGQQINRPAEEMPQDVVQEETSGSQEERNISWKLADNIDSDEVEISGLVNSDDYPYGYNIGRIQDDIFEQAVLITPETEINIHFEELKGSYLQIAYQIHPWVAQGSDGAVLQLTLMHDSETDELEYEVSAQMESAVIGLTEYLGQEVTVQMRLSNREGNNEECDWVVISDFAIQAVSSADNENTDDVHISDESSFGSGGYVRSATYFADECPINFWNSEMDHLADDLRQIARDGFDSIIVVVPWREFQPEIAPVSYNPYAFEALSSVMKAADEQELNVYVRVGYTWDYYNDADDYILDRYSGLLEDKVYLEAWLDYVRTLYETLSGYENFGGGFLTWEDHWNRLGICNVESVDERLEKAKELGYQEWVQNHYSLANYNERYGTSYQEYGQIAIPKRTEADMYAMYEFYDYLLMDLLSLSQERFPNLSMEVRLDWDFVYDKDGNPSHYEHTATYGCGNSDYVAAMYGIPMGCVNNGERISYTEAMGKTENTLKNLLSVTRGKPTYIEQFIFADNTPEYSYNAQIIEGEENEYLKNIAGVLSAYSRGYGIWTYQNYRKNMLYNSQFVLNDIGWSREGDVRFEEKQDSVACGLAEGASIAQYIPNGRYSFVSDKYYCSFSVREASESAKLQVDIGGVTDVIDVSGGEEIKLSYAVDSNLNSDLYIEFEAVEGEIWIDNVRLYSHIQEGFLYNEENVELRCIEGIRALNDELSKVN